MKKEVSPCEHGYYGLCPQCVRDERDALRAHVKALEFERRSLIDAGNIRTDELHRIAVKLCCAAERDVIDASIDGLSDMAECAAIMAVAGYFSRMRGPDAWLDHGSWDEYPELFACAGVDLRSFQHGTRFYAGSAPVPAAQAEAKVSVGDSRFESWIAQYNPSGKGDKQRARDAYAAGMNDPAEAKVADDVVRDAVPASWIEAARKAKMITADVCRAYPETAAAHINGLANLLLAAKAKGE